MHEISIESSLVETIRSGDKSIEGRLGEPRYLAIKEGDSLLIREDIWNNGEVVGSHDDDMYVKVTQVLYFESFKEMLGAVNYEDVVPYARSLREAVNEYAKFYSTKDEEEYGVVAIFFERPRED